MQSNLRKDTFLAALLLAVVLFAAAQIDAQSQTPAPPVLTDVQVQALVQALLAQEASGSKSLTPAQAQLLAQYLTAQSQTAATAATPGANAARTSAAAPMTPAQAQWLAQYLALQSQTAAAVPAMTAAQVPGISQVFPQNPGQPAGTLAPSPLGPKKPAVVRIGVVQPKAQMGQGNSGSNVAEPIRSMISQYLSGPSQEVVPLTAMLSSQIDAEAKAKECDYVLYSEISQKMSSGGAMGFLKKAGPMASMIPMVGMTSGVTGAMAGAAASTAMAGAASVASTIKAKSEVTFDYKLIASGNATAILANTEKAKAKDDGEDVISPLIDQAATAIIAEVTKARK
jgi:hypothetical protein